MIREARRAALVWAQTRDDEDAAWRERFLDLLDECHQTEPCPVLPGLCTRFATSRRLRIAVRQAWGVPEDCGECFPEFDQLRECATKPVLACEDQLASLVEATMQPAPGQQPLLNFDACRWVLEPHVAAHALVAIALRRNVWGVGVDVERAEMSKIKRLASLELVFAPDGHNRTMTIRSLAAMSSWSPKPGMDLAEAAEALQGARHGEGTTLAGMLDSAVQARIACKDRDAEHELMARLPGAVAAIRDGPSVWRCDEEPFVIVGAARRLIAWQAAGVCVGK
jgi:hypothetical protein